MGTRVDRRTTLVMDRATATVLREEFPNPASGARTWVRWLHTGEAFGFMGQTIAGIASLAACFLVYRPVESHAAFAARCIPPEPRLFKTLCVALRSKYIGIPLFRDFLHRLSSALLHAAVRRPD